MCRDARVHGDSLNKLAKQIDCDLTRSERDICSETPPMPRCDDMLIGPKTKPGKLIHYGHFKCYYMDIAIRI